MSFLGLVGVWATVYLGAAIVTSQVAETSGCGTGGSDRLLVLVPAAMSFMGVVMVGFWNRPERRARRRGRSRDR